MCVYIYIYIYIYICIRERPLGVRMKFRNIHILLRWSCFQSTGER